MKKILLACLIIAGITVSATAQKGSILAYGSISFSTLNDPAKNTTNNFEVSPGLGYQFGNHIAAGVELAFVSHAYKADNPGPVKRNINAINIGPFVRYTQPVGGPFFIFGQFNAAYLGGKDKMNDGITTSEAKYTGFAFNLFPAVGINIKKGFALNFNLGGIGYTSTKLDSDANPAATFGFTFGKTVNIGVSKNFGGKKN